MNRIPLIIAVLTFCVGIGFSSAEVYKWLDKDGVEHFSDYKTDIPEGTPFEAQDETLFDPAADAKREKQDQKTMDEVDKEEDQMISETKREDEQAAQQEKAETPASSVIVEEDDEIYWRDHERRRAGELNERDQFEHNEIEHNENERDRFEHNENEHNENEHNENEHHEIEHRVVHPVAR